MKQKYKTRKVFIGDQVLFPRVGKSIQDTTAPAEIDTRSLPVGRVSVDNVTFGELMREFMSEMSSVGKIFPLEYLEAMQNISLVNPDVAQMIDNLVQLGNTGHKVMIETGSDRVRKDITDELNQFGMTVFSRFGGIDGFVNSALAQIARGGAVSVEWVVNDSMSGIDQFVFVPLKDIRFFYSTTDSNYLPYQKTSDLSAGENGYIPLNVATYQYCAMQLLDNSPYAVPPILSAMESIIIQRDIIKNLRFISKKMGLLGFVNFLIKAPKQIAGEKTDDYINRCQQFLDDQAERLKYNYRDGIAVGFMDSFTVEHHSITGDASGAKELFEMNEQQVFSGLKADPALHGRTYSTTETYAGVVYEKMLSIIGNYQRTVKAVLEYGYKLHLALKGFEYDSLWIEFEPSKSLSSERDEGTYATKLANLKTLYDQGIIDQNQFAQEAGYDQPVEAGPRTILSSTVTPEGNRTANSISLSFDRSSGRYFVPVQKKQHGCSHAHESFELNAAQEQVERFQREYLAAIYPLLKRARGKGLKAVKAFLEDFDFDTGDSDLFASGILETMGVGFVQTLEKTSIEKSLLSELTLIYSYFRLEDKEPFLGEFPIKPSFNLVDEKAIDFLKKSDRFYFGRYLTNPQTQKDLKTWIVDHYLRSGRNLRDAGELNRFRLLFENRVAKEDYKILRIVETTVNRARNWGNIFLVEEAGGASIEITGPIDNLTCRWCQAMTGKKFKVTPVAQHVKDILERDPESLPQLNPFLPGKLHPALVDELSESQLLAQGIALPPYHPHCRHGYVVDRFK